MTHIKGENHSVVGRAHIHYKGWEGSETYFMTIHRNSKTTLRWANGPVGMANEKDDISVVIIEEENGQVQF